MAGDVEGARIAAIESGTSDRFLRGEGRPGKLVDKDCEKDPVCLEYLQMIKDRVYARWELGADAVLSVIHEAAVSTVNLAETVSRLSETGARRVEIAHQFSRYTLDVVPFDEAQAWTAGLLRPLTRSRGLSFADRACLALALALDLPVLTGDRAWEGLDVGVDVRLFR